MKNSIKNMYVYIVKNKLSVQEVLAQNNFLLTCSESNKNENELLALNNIIRKQCVGGKLK